MGKQCSVVNKAYIDHQNFTIENSPKKQYENNFDHIYTVPIQVYNDKVFREKLKNANSSRQVEFIVRNYFKYKRINCEQVKKKKHWWSKS